MKRGDLLRHLRQHGCYLKREGAAHSLWCNPATGHVEAIPRHTEISNNLARKICRNLSVPEIGTQGLSTMSCSGRGTPGQSPAAELSVLREKHTKSGLRRYGKWFLTKGAKRAAATGATMPADPYACNWYGERETDLFRDIGGQVLLEGACAPFSEWHHWRPGAIGRQISFDEGTSTFGMSTADPNYAAMSYAPGFQCLWQTMRILNRRCRLRIGTQLQDLKLRQGALAAGAGRS